MKKLIFLTCLLFASHGLAETVRVKAVDGVVVEINYGEILKAYLNITPGLKINRIIKNTDGTYTILNPRYDLAGKGVYFDQYNLSSELRSKGVCRYFGFESQHGGEYIRLTNENDYPATIVEMHESGQAKKVFTQERELTDRSVLASMVCSS